MCVVMFGVTGDLARKKLMPAMYDLANRGSAPAGILLRRLRQEGLGGRGFRPGHLSGGQGARPHALPRHGMGTAQEGVRFVSGSFNDDEAFDQLATCVRELDAERGTGGTTRSTCRSRPASFLPWPAAEAQRPFRLQRPGLAQGSDREAVRPRPGQRAGAERHPERGLPPGGRVPHRPLPRQGDGAEHPRAALRQRDVRADLEPRLRGPYPDHDGRGHWHRRRAGYSTASGPPGT